MWGVVGSGHLTGVRVIIIKICLFWLLCCTVSNLFTRKSRLLLLLAFCVLSYFYILPVLIGVSGLQVPLLPGQGYIRGKKENPGNSLSCCSSRSRVTSQYTFISPPFRGFWCLFFIYWIQRLCLVEGLGRNVSFHLCETEYPKWFKIKTLPTVLGLGQIQCMSLRHHLPFIYI